MKFSQLHMYVVPIWGRAHGQLASSPPPYFSSPGVILSFAALILEMNCSVPVLSPWGDGTAL